MTLIRYILRCSIWLLVGPVVTLLVCYALGVGVWLSRAGLGPDVLKIMALGQKVSQISLAGFWALVGGLLGLACLVGAIPKIRSPRALVPLAVAGIFFFVCLKLAPSVKSRLATSVGQKMASAVLVLGPLFVMAWPLFFLLQPHLGDKESSKVRRGARILKGSPEMLQRKLKAFASKKAEGPPGVVIWNDCRLPRGRENEGILLAGSPGSGKTQIIYPILQEVRRRGTDKIILYDYKANYTEAISGETDVALLAPWDSRSLRWSLGRDISSPLSCHSAARILIPSSSRESQPYFPDTARDVLQATMFRLDAEGNSWSFADLWEKLSMGKDKLGAFISKTDLGRAAAEHLRSDPKSSSSIYSTLLQKTGELMWLAKAWQEGNFSVRKWVRDTSPIKTLIISGLPGYKEIAHAASNLALHMAVNEILSLPDDLNRRIWLFLDELPRLGALDILLEAFAAGRSKGLCVVAGIQDIGQIQEKYGRDLAQTISNTFNSKIILRSTDPQTAEWGSGVIGQQEVEETFRGKTTHGGTLTATPASQTTHPQVRTQSAVLASMIINLEDKKGYLCVPGWDIPLLDWSPKVPLPKNYSHEILAGWVDEKAIKQEGREPPPDTIGGKGEDKPEENKDTSAGAESKATNWNLE